MRKLFTFFVLAVLSISAFSASITLKVSMKGSGMTYDSVFVVGKSLIGPGATKDWEFVYMTPEADSVYSVTFNLTKGDTVVYYFSTGNNWDTYLDFRETVDTNCDASMEIVGWAGDRGFIVPDAATTIGFYFSSCEELTIVNGIESPSFNQSFELFPNPANGFVTLTLSQLTNQTISIFDISGKSVKVMNATDLKMNIDISDLSKGVYMVKVSDGEVRKMIVR